MEEKERYKRQLCDGWKEDLEEGYVFISYSSQDWEKVYPCVLALRELHVNAFIDPNFQKDKGWLKNIEERLFNDIRCKAIVAFVSSGYLGSYACLVELLANRTDTQHMKRGEPLPVFYIALEEDLGTAQNIRRHLLKPEVRTQLSAAPVECAPVELAKMEEYLLDLREEGGRWEELRKRKLLNNLRQIRNRFNVAYFMNDLIFANTDVESMPSFMLFRSGDGFVQELARDLLELLPLNSGAAEAPGTELDRLEARAEQGDADAQFDLGWSYESGEGVTQDYEQAAYWYRKAAEQGHMAAQNNLGACYESGKGVAQDFAQAADWYRKAAEQGHAAAQFNLGACYDNGEGVAQDFAQAAYWYRKAAEQGYANAQFNLGACYDNGRGVAQDVAQAVDWYRKAAEQGYAVAQYNLGSCYENGEGVEEDETQAADWYRRAAEQGYAAAQYELGACYRSGYGVEEDEAQAVYWLRQAAEQGHADAQYNLGFCYKNGQGVARDAAQAADWYRKAAEQGHAAAQYELGVCYHYGDGVEQDLTQAMDWFRKAAAQGYSYARKLLEK